MDIERIRSRIRTGEYTISFTHTEKLRERMIEAADLEEAVFNGSIIEPYPDDPRGPSCLILGFSISGKPLHIVCGNLEEESFSWLRLTNLTLKNGRRIGKRGNGGLRDAP